MRQAGCCSIRKSRQTGAEIGVYNAAEAFLDTERGKYAVVCHTHNCILACSTLRLSLSLASAPKEWCEQCRESPC